MNAKARVPPCAAEGPGCDDCGARHVHCLLPTGHEGDHHHDSRRTRCRPITWPADHPTGDDDG